MTREEIEKVEMWVRGLLVGLTPVPDDLIGATAQNLAPSIAEIVATREANARQDERDAVADWLARQAYPAQAVRVVREGGHR